MVIEEKKEKRWYMVHTYSGYENKVKANLEQRIASMGMEDKIFRVLVPVEERVSMRGGKKKVIKRKVFPGYVLVEMILDDHSWYVVRHTPGVTGFVGTGTQPIPLSDEEVRDIMSRIGMEGKKKQVEIDLEPGDLVRITGGSFNGMTGTVTEVIPERGKVKMLVTLFGRDTPVEVDFMNVEKV